MYMIKMVTATANTITEPSLALIVGRRSSGRMATSLPDPFGHLSSLFLKGVPDTVHGADVLRLGRLFPELAADPCNVGIDDSPAGVVAVAPHPVHQLIPTEHHARASGQGEQDLELERSEHDLVVAPGDPPSRGVDAEVEASHRLGRVRLLDAVRPAEDRSDPSRQLAQAERLRQVIVGADCEPGHLVGLLRPSGEHEHRYPVAPLEFLAYLEPVHAG